VATAAPETPETLPPLLFRGREKAEVAAAAPPLCGYVCPEIPFVIKGPAEAAALVALPAAAPVVPATPAPLTLAETPAVLVPLALRETPVRRVRVGTPQLL